MKGNTDKHTLTEIAGVRHWQGFVCEFCAVQICNRCCIPSWQLESRHPGRTLRTDVACSSCDGGHRSSSPGVQEIGLFTKPFLGISEVEDVARFLRCATHCRTCRQKLEGGLPLAQPSHSNFLKSDPNSAGEASLLVENMCSTPVNLIWCDQYGELQFGLTFFAYGIGCVASTGWQTTVGAHTC